MMIKDDDQKERDQRLPRQSYVLVTGAGARVGRAIACALAERGTHLIIHYHHNQSGAEETLDQVRSLGGTGHCVRADLSQSHELDHLADVTREQSKGRLDLLVNNASLFSPSPAESLSLSEWDNMLRVNLSAPFFLVNRLLSSLRSAQGVIVNLCDISADRPLKGYAHYTASKAGLVGLTKALAVELAPQVRCVGISPGQVAWPPDYNEQQKKQLLSRIPLKRSGNPDDIGRLVRFIVKEGTYLNGAIIPVDGGLACRY